jgi:hypothetical protein|tara:strand:- start:18695 stop:23365 length:4671 start_codon:yes stop_codon:yes gene_type:complete
MANIDLNISPYFDDFNDQKDFLRVLFRPGFPIQARELTQAQTILQEQITRLGDHLFKDGSRITGAKIDFDNQSKRITLTGASNVSYPASSARTGAILSNISSLEGRVISNATGTVKAVVITSPVGTLGTNSVGALYVKYITSDTFSTVGGYIYATVADNPTLTAEIYNTYSSITDCSVAHIEEGVYYIQGYFTRIAKQTVVVDATSVSPSLKLGFTISESLITPNNDSTLFDNARGSTNEGAPGAHRLKLALSFSIRALTADNDPNFFQLMLIENGVAQQQSSRGGIHSSLGDTFAVRTNEGHGDFTVDPIKLNFSVSDSDTSIIVNTSKIHAYVKGYRINNKVNNNIRVNKPLSSSRIDSQTVGITGVPHIKVLKEIDNALPGFNTATGNNPHQHTNRLLLQDSDANTYGYARAYSFEAQAGGNKLHLYDIKFFQKIRLIGSTVHTTLNIGHDIKSINDTRGYVTKLESTGVRDVNHVGDSDVLVMDYTKPFRVGQVVKSTVDTTLNRTIDKVTTYSWANITNIAGKSGTFKVERKASTKLQNGSGKLFGEVDGVVKTARTDAKVFDNDYEVMYSNPPVIASNNGTVAITPNTNDTFFSTQNANGDFVRTRIDDGNEISKMLKFKHIKIRNDRTSSSINYGWSAQDRENTLVYSDVYDVYGINKGTTNNKFSHFEQINVTVTGGGTIPQGSIIRGAVSNTVARVVLSNSDKNETELTGTAGYHTSRTGTGSTTVLEIIKNIATRNFTANETFIIISPNSSDKFVNVVTYVSTRTSPINETTEVFGTNIDDNYFLDHGQRNNIYEISRLVRKPLTRAPETGDLTVFYSYWEDQDSTNKFYYTADSYSSAGFFATDPRYFDSQMDLGNKDRLKGDNLKNAVDFRKKLKANVNTGQNAFIFNHKVFENRPFLLPGLGNNSNLSNAKFTFTFDEYLSRYDIYYVASKPYFGLRTLSSLPARNPQIPKFDSNLGMKIATAFLPAALIDTREIINIPQDNRRYTMSDIGGIEKRISRLEDAVSLSFLETQALTDDTSDRTKLGFIVDDFRTSKDDVVQDIEMSTAVASIADETLRPNSVTSYVETEILDVTSTGLAAAKIDPYYYTQGFITKSYTQAPAVGDNEYISQLQASGTTRINPYAQLQYKGYITLDPARDFTNDADKRQITKYIIDRTGSVNDSDVSLNEFNLNVLPIPTSEPWAESWSNVGTATQTSTRSGNRITTTTAQNQIRNVKQKQFVTRDNADTFQLDEVKIDMDAWTRSRSVMFNAEGLRPNVTLKANLEYYNITPFTQMTDSATGEITYSGTTAGVLTTDSLGMIRGKFTIPAQTFRTGNLIFQLYDTQKTTIAAAIYTVAAKYDIGEMNKFRTEGIEDVTIRTENHTTTTSSTSYLRYSGGGGDHDHHSPGSFWGGNPSMAFSDDAAASTGSLGGHDFGGTNDNDGGGASGGQDGGTFICTAAWDTGLSTPKIWSMDKRYGVMIKKQDPLAYAGYTVWGPWVANRVRKGKLQFVGNTLPKIWAYRRTLIEGKDTREFSNFIKILSVIWRGTAPFNKALGWLKVKLG